MTSVFYPDPQIIFVSIVLLGQITSMFKVACLPAYSNGSLQVKRQLVAFSGITFRLGLDEAIESGDVLQLGVGIEKEGCVVCVG